LAELTIRGNAGGPIPQHLLRTSHEPGIDQIGRGLLALAQTLGQLQQVNAPQRVGFLA
jgi:hypothetical protein